MDNMKNIPERPDEEKLLDAIFADESLTRAAKSKASEYCVEHGVITSVESIIMAVEVAQMSLAQDFIKWTEMEDDEKRDLSEMMCGLMVARDLIADMFGLPTEGRIEHVEEE